MNAVNRDGLWVIQDWGGAILRDCSDQLPLEFISKENAEATMARIKVAKALEHTPMGSPVVDLRRLWTR